MSSPYVYAILAAEIFSIPLCIVLFYANSIESHRHSERSTIYSVMLATNILALAADALSWLLEGRADCTVILYISTGISIVLALVLVGEFAMYITAYIAERRAISVPVYSAAMIAIIISIIVTIIACCFGHLFTYIDGCYIIGQIYYIYNGVNILALLVCIAVVTYYRKDLGVHDSIVAYIYIAIPAITALMGTFIEDWSFAYPACTLSLLVLYVTIQNDQTDQLEQEKQTSRYHAMHDELTGLLSRRAYIEKIGALAEAEGRVGVIFCDVNGLKYTNDNYGHSAGDELLVCFAGLLCKHFDKSVIFRVSGDEFIVMLEEDEQTAFESRALALEAALTVDGKQLACMGCDYGDCRDVLALSSQAETRMYESKKLFHEKHPELAR